MTRKRIYLAGPISRGNLADNVNQATAAFVALAKAGFAPWCPHWSVYSKPCRSDSGVCDNGGYIREGACLVTGTRNGNEEMSHADWLGVDLAWVEVADAVLRLPGESTGADQECAYARHVGIPVLHSVAEVLGFRWLP